MNKKNKVEELENIYSSLMDKVSSLCLDAENRLREINQEENKNEI